VDLPLTLALLDAAVGIYLVAYAIRREKRDKPAVLVVGIFLLACAAALGWLALPERGAGEPGRLPMPAGELAMASAQPPSGERPR
jgi:hypothetical protein